MTLLDANCPRCGAQRMTFDLTQETRAPSGKWETFCVCRRCELATIFVLMGSQSPLQCGGMANKKLTVMKFVSTADEYTRCSPAHVPDPIAAAFNEGAKCLAIDCFNAAATMFRLAVDLATSELLPSDDAEPPDKLTRRYLGRRLTWLFKNGKLPERFKRLAKVVTDDGNDAAHQGGAALFRRRSREGPWGSESDMARAT